MSRRELCITLLAILGLSVGFTLVAYRSYRPITGPAGVPLSGELTRVQEVRSLPDYIVLHITGTDAPLHLDLTDKTRPLLEEPAMLGQSFTFRAERHFPAKSVRNDYYVITEMTAADGSFAFTWEDRAAVQSAALRWELPLSFGLVWVCGGIYLWLRSPFKKRK